MEERESSVLAVVVAESTAILTKDFLSIYSCHLREKVLAEAAHHFILVADSRKDSKILGDKWKQGVPVEVAPFAWAKVFQNLQKMGCEKPVLRMGKMKAGPVVTDNG